MALFVFLLKYKRGEKYEEDMVERKCNLSNLS